MSQHLARFHDDTVLNLNNLGFPKLYIRVYFRVYYKLEFEVLNLSCEVKNEAVSLGEEKPISLFF